MPRRGPKTWTTPEEEVFLQSQLPAYIACQATKVYHTFWNTMTREFLSRWPERARLTDIPQDVELSDEQKSRVAQAILKRQSVSCITPSRSTYLIEKNSRLLKIGFDGVQMSRVWPARADLVF